RLFFRALDALDADWTMWLHAEPETRDKGADDANAADSRPEQDPQPHYVVLHQHLDTSHWPPDRLHEVVVDRPLPPGPYHIRLGIWRWQDGTRLWRDDSPNEHEINLGWVDL